MALEEVSNQGSVRLRDLYDKWGSCEENGFFTPFSQILIGEGNRVCFASDVSDKGLEVHSFGVVLPDSLVIKQTKETERNMYYQLFAWSADNSSFTRLGFDNLETMDYTFQEVVGQNVNLCEGDISESLSRLNVDFEHVAQVLTKQRKNPLYDMFQDTDSSEEVIQKRH